MDTEEDVLQWYIDTVDCLNRLIEISIVMDGSVSALEDAIETKINFLTIIVKTDLIQRYLTNNNSVEENRQRNSLTAIMNAANAIKKKKNMKKFFK